jgi:hypothetical protein
MEDVMGTPLTLGPTPLGVMEPLIYDPMFAVRGSPVASERIAVAVGEDVVGRRNAIGRVEKGLSNGAVPSRFMRSTLPRK